MHRLPHRAIVTAFVCCVFSFAAKVSVAQQKYWIEFRDKGIRQAELKLGSPAYDTAIAELSPEAIARRNRSQAPLVSIEDVEINANYLRSLSLLGVTPIVTSKWQNAVSAFLTDAQCHELATLDFVRSVHPVGKGMRLGSEEAMMSVFLPSARRSTSVMTVDTTCGYDPVIYHYGGAQSQLERINVVPLHAMGLDATNVRFGHLDTGQRWRALSSLMTRHIVSEYDYVFKDSVTANQPGDLDGQDIHGTNTLSCAIGYEPDHLVGPAYNATMMLAKTEDERSETPLEEDYYSAALEDMEAKGVDITTTSLGYFNFDSGYTSYVYGDLNGKTTISARASAHAVKLGVLVVSAMGNSGATANPYMMTPADADSIISVGGLDVNDTIAGFSSRGPTADGRMKPEICAPGVLVWCQNIDSNFYGFTGTSFATPLTSSACCLIKQAHPEATAQEIRQAVIHTGDRSHNPDTAYGYGKLNAYAAALDLGMIVHIKNVWYDSTVHLCAGISSKYGVLGATVVYSTSDDPIERVLPMKLVTDSLIYASDLPKAGIHGGERITFRVTGTDIKGETKNPSDYVFTVPITSTNDVKISLYPQPSANLLNLQVNAAGKWTLYDAAGRSILSSTISTASERVTISTAAIANGPYYLLFKSDKGETKGASVLVSH